MVFCRFTNQVHRQRGKANITQACFASVLSASGSNDEGHFKLDEVICVFAVSYHEHIMHWQVRYFGKVDDMIPQVHPSSFCCGRYCG